ncbi:hypothetical protein BJY04DRAFT_180946 [Aspergillus karnatakaensis]|uniref:uncharacterized protein n=1 Tax=Aspergillus karnatakaensis TaxID=1810916 RepID=UPI003CCD6D25
MDAKYYENAGNPLSTEQPPAYQHHPHQQTQYQRDEKSTSQRETYPRGIEVAFTSWTSRHLRLTSETKDGALLYTADLKNTKPHMRIQGSSGTDIATVRFHRFSHSVDMSINGREILLTQGSKLSYSRGFESPSLGGKRLTWKKSSMWKSFHLECTDESGIVYATYKPHGGFSTKKSGRLEVLEPCRAGGDAVLDELVVSALVNIYILIKMSGAAAAGAGAGAGAGGGGGC